jgi:hypothetical protein
MSETATSTTITPHDAASFAAFVAHEAGPAFDVRGISVLFLFKDRQAHSRLVGLHDEKQLSSWVRAAR